MNWFFIRCYGSRFGLVGEKNMATLTTVTWISNGSMYHRHSNTKISKATVPLKDLVMVTSSFHLDEKFVMVILFQKTQNCDLDFIISGANFMDGFILTLNFFFLFHHDSHTYVWSEQKRRWGATIPEKLGKNYV